VRRDPRRADTEVVDAAHDRRRLGELLVEEGFLTEEQLAAALAEQARSGRKLGEVIVASGLLSGPALANVLADQHGGVLRTEYGIAMGTGRNSAPHSESTEYLLFVPVEGGYAMQGVWGPLPTVGEQMRLANRGETFVVVKTGSSPLPDDPRTYVSLRAAASRAA
jgi:hypothetical protein